MKTCGIMFGELLPIPTDPALDPPPKACYNCWQMGHSCVRCPRPSTVFCHNCGRRGADLTVCPQCWVTHRAYIRQKYGRDGPRQSTSHRQGNMAAATPESRTSERRVTTSRAVSPMDREDGRERDHGRRCRRRGPSPLPLESLGEREPPRRRDGRTRQNPGHRMSGDPWTWEDPREERCQQPRNHLGTRQPRPEGLRCQYRRRCGSSTACRTSR